VEPITFSVACFLTVSVEAAIALAGHRVGLRVSILVVALLRLSIRLNILLGVITRETTVVWLLSLVALLAMSVGGATHYLCFVFHYDLFEQVVHRVVLTFLTCRCLILLMVTLLI
jgi:hypothetical protein